jgi:hypothetical protein
VSEKKVDVEGTKRLMGALVRMKPKPHDEMKVGKAAKKERPVASKKSKGAASR